MHAPTLVAAFVVTGCVIAITIHYGKHKVDQWYDKTYREMIADGRLHPNGSHHQWKLTEFEPNERHICRNPYDYPDCKKLKCTVCNKVKYNCSQGVDEMR